jgi:hypothetical protein
MSSYQPTYPRNRQMPLRRDSPVTRSSLPQELGVEEQAPMAPREVSQTIAWWQQRQADERWKLAEQRDKSGGGKEVGGRGWPRPGQSRGDGWGEGRWQSATPACLERVWILTRLRATATALTHMCVRPAARVQAPGAGKPGPKVAPGAVAAAAKAAEGGNKLKVRAGHLVGPGPRHALQPAAGRAVGSGYTCRVHGRRRARIGAPFPGRGRE